LGCGVESRSRSQLVAKVVLRLILSMPLEMQLRMEGRGVLVKRRSKSQLERR
jgi:hypothetical protein